MDFGVCTLNTCVPDDADIHLCYKICHWQQPKYHYSLFSIVLIVIHCCVHNVKTNDGMRINNTYTHTHTR